MWVAVAVAGTTLVSGMISSNAQSNAAESASNAQIATSQAGIAQQNKQFEAIQKLLEPYSSAGTGALAGQKDLIGLNGGAPQQSAIDALKNGPQFQSMLKTGENSILANASATGGLRGGNTQAALAQFSPSMLSALINDQYSKLGGLTSIGQNAAAGTGNAGMQTGNNISTLLGQIGSAQAGNALAQGRATSGWVNSATGALGTFAGMGGFNGLSNNTVPQVNQNNTGNVGMQVSDFYA